MERQQKFDFFSYDDTPNNNNNNNNKLLENLKNLFPVTIFLDCCNAMLQ